MGIESIDPVDLTRELVRFDTTTPKDSGLQSFLISKLRPLGFRDFALPFNDVQNFYAQLGQTGPHFCFAGHTDVVPSGPADQWTFPPFAAVLDQDCLIGRGVADMKGAVAAMISAVSSFLAKRPLSRGSISFLITGDEEGPAVDGTAKVMEWLNRSNEKIDYCLVGEPTSVRQIGDTIKFGRRGSINGRILLYGVQGHTAYPALARNPLHEALPFLSELVNIRFDEGNESFEPTHLSLTNMNGGTGTNNVIPDRLEIRFNIRNGTASSFKSIQDKIEQTIQQSGIRYSLEMLEAGRAFLTPKRKLVETLVDSVRECEGITPELSTSGGTSDARFIAPAGIDVAELGLKNESIHKINERAPVQDIRKLAKIYETLLTKLL